MRLTAATAALIALLAPASVLASNVTTTQTWTSTVTKTLVYANATVTMHMPSSSVSPATATFNPTLTGSGAQGSATPGNYIGNGAGSEQSNLFVAGLAGAAALVFISL
jgi:hypothetical protein